MLIVRDFLYYPGSLIRFGFFIVLATLALWRAKDAQLRGKSPRLPGAPAKDAQAEQPCREQR